MEEILWMWKFVGVLLTLLVSKITSAPSEEIKLVCVSCKNGGSLLVGNAGEDLVLRYDILNRNFTLFEVDYADNKVEMSKGYISTKYVKDKRLIVPKKVTKKGDTTSIQLTLKSLSLETDNLVPFKYTYRNFDLDIFNDETAVHVLAPPTFCKPPKKTYKINSGVKVPIEFSLCGNPQPTVAASLGSKIIPVKYLNSTSKYSFNYGIELLLSKEQCGETLEFEAKSASANASASSEIKVLFHPDPVKNVTAVRDSGNVLTVSWQGIQQVGSCAPQYHVKRTLNSVVEKWGTRETSYIFHGAEGNNTISVNAEINGREGEYSEPIFIAAEIPKNETGHSKQVQGDGIGVGGIVGIVIALIVIVALVLFILWSRKRNEKNDAHNSNFDVTKDTDPLSEPHENNETDKMQPGDELIYAELGPGGRQGDKKPSPQSNYSKPKTDGMYYPDPKKPVVGSSKPSWSSVSIQPEDDSFDYQSSIVI